MSLNINGEVTIIIPTLNEADAIGDVIDELHAHGITNIIVVDGHSTDGTDKIAREKGATVIYQDGKGKADAVRKGLSHVKTKYALIMDGDWTYPAKHVEELYLKAEEGYDQVIGVRIEEPGAQSVTFRIGNKMLTWIFNLLFGTSLKDVLSGMYIVRMNALADALLFMEGFSIESEIAAHIASTSLSIAEVPITYRKRKGRKKLGKKHGLLIARDMIRLAWRYNPSFVIFALGALLLIPGVSLAAWVIYEYLFHGIKHHIWGIIAVTLSSSGFNSLLFAVISIYLKHLEYRMNRKINELCKPLQLRQAER